MTDSTPPELTAEELEYIESVFELARAGETAQLARTVEAGVPVNLTNARGDSLLILAAYHQRADTVDALISLGADVDRVNDMGQTATSCAVFRNNPDIVLALLKAGADPDLGSHTALQIAQQFELAEMQRLLTSARQGD